MGPPPQLMCDFAGDLSCYRIRKPQVAQKENLEAKPSKSGSTVQWKKRCQKGLKCQAGSVSSQRWMVASVLPFTDGRAKGQKGTFPYRACWGMNLCHLLKLLNTLGRKRIKV